MVIGFDTSAAALAHTLREELTGLGVEVRPLMKGASRPYLEEHEAEVRSKIENQEHEHVLYRFIS